MTSYIEVNLTDQKLTLTSGETSEVFSLENRAVANGIIYNPSYLKDRVQNFAQKNGLKAPRLIIYIPKSTDFMVLQYTLCFAKTGFVIETVVSVHTPEASENHWKQQPNLLQHFLPKYYHKTHHWAVSVILVLCCLGFFGFSGYTTLTTQTDQLNLKNTDLLSNNTQLQSQVKQVHALEQSNATLQQQIKRVKTLTRQKKHVFKTLVNSAQATPADSFLTSFSIKIGPKTSKKPNLILEGIAPSPAKIHDILKYLASLYPKNHFSLEYVKPMKKLKNQTATPQKAQKTYKFRVLA